MFTEWKSCALPTDWVSRWQALPHTVGRVWGACRGALRLCVISKYPIRHAGHLALNPWGQRILMQGCMTARRCANVLAWGFPGVTGRHVVGRPFQPLQLHLCFPLSDCKALSGLLKFQLASWLSFNLQALGAKMVIAKMAHHWGATQPAKPGGSMRLHLSADVSWCNWVFLVSVELLGL